MLSFDQTWETLSGTRAPKRFGRSQRRSVSSWLAGVLAVVWGVAIGIPGSPAFAGPGIATPPNPGRGVLPSLSFNPPILPPGGTAATTHGFTSIGFIQDATVSDTNCLDPNTNAALPRSQWGGSAIVNGIKITIPCNMIIQMPAATYTWADLLDWGASPPAPTPAAPLTLAVSAAPFSFPSTEMTINGNIVAGEHIAGLIFISQQSLNTGTGTILAIDNANGALTVANKSNGTKVRLQINDPKITDTQHPAPGTGRYSAGQSPDPRFSVDQSNPTIHAATGYPMCIPRNATQDDALCPQKNRPLAASGCRNFAQAHVTLPTAREIAPPAAGQKYCSGFVMKAPPGTQPNLGQDIATDLEPDAREQAPLEIGDLIIWSGTLLKGDGNGPLDASGNKTDTISVNTINANVGIFTEPGSLPVYLMITDSRMSADNPLILGVIPQEPIDRLVVEAFVTDVTSIVDVYLVDIDSDPKGVGKQTQRWVTPQSMTGGIGATASDGKTFINGGITTQFAGLVPGRVRLQANKSVPGILTSPTRNIRVVARSLCDPLNINGNALPYNASARSDPPAVPVACLERAPVANGLFSGQYIAPNFRYIFPENVVAGDPIVPYDFWHFGFLLLGEGPNTGPLNPKPW